MGKKKEKEVQKKKSLGKSPIKYSYEDGEISDITVSKDHPIAEDTIQNILQKLTGTDDDELASEIFLRGVGAMPQNFGKAHNMNQIVQTLAEASPRDATEARLSVQASVLYAQGMQNLARAESHDMMCHIEFYTKNGMKLLRLHNETIEALNKLRRGGEQRVVVQHVNVNDGGKAAFMSANITPDKGGGKEKNRG